MIGDREERDGEADAQAAMQVTEVTKPGMDSEARWVRKGSQSVFSYKQHMVVDSDGLVIAVTTTVANCHDIKPLLVLLEKTHIRPGIRIHADQKHRDAFKLAMAYNLKRLPKLLTDRRMIMQA